jgi:hypothetical protein
VSNVSASATAGAGQTGILGVIDQSTGSSKHHGTVAGNQQFEGFAITGRDEAIQQHGVFRLHGFVAQPAKVALQRFD